MNLANHLLISTPVLDKDFFARAVILLCEHSSIGAFGLVLNQPLSFTLTQLIESLDSVENPNSIETNNTTIYKGGPVNPQNGYILYCHEEPVILEESINVGNTFYLTAAKSAIEYVANGKMQQPYRIALGCSGWSDGQLEEEIKSNAWLTTPASHDLVFDHFTDTLWEKSLHSMGINPANLSIVTGHA